MKKTFFALFIALCMTSLSALAQKTYSFTGILGGNINFRLDLQENSHGLIAGETTYYRKNGKISRIKVIGFNDSEFTKSGKSDFSIIGCEFDGTKICGRIVVNIHNGKINGGSWDHGEKDLKMSDIHQTTFPKGKTFFHPAKLSELAGEYSYKNDFGQGPNALRFESGGCTIKVKGQKVTYDVESWTPNLANYRNTTTFKGSWMKVSKKPTHNIYFDRDFIIFRVTGDTSDMGWGAHATFGGIYIKEK